MITMMKEKVLRNLYLAVDYADVKAEDGTKTPQFYLVGVLPVLIDYQDGKQEVAKLKIPEPISSNDPELRSLMGKKATDEKRKLYRPVIRKLVKRLAQAITNAKLSNSWNGKEIKDVSIVKIEHGESRTTAKI